MREPTECLRCRGPMERGFLVDRGHYDSKNVPKWIEGEPTHSWMGLRTKGKESHPVQTYRCERCGWLESYAIPD